MSQKKILIDIQTNKETNIDIRSFFPSFSAHAVLERQKEFVDSFDFLKKDTIDISLPMSFHIDPFMTLGTLDLTSRELLQATAFRRKFLGGPSRDFTLSIIEPLFIPYGSLDIRTLSMIPQAKKYDDLYRRKLPLRLFLRRTKKEAYRWTKKNKKGIVSIALTTLIVTAPALLYVKFAIESGYAQLASLSPHMSQTEIEQTLHSARSYFERGQMVFFPFSWIGEEHFQLAKNAINGGQQVTRAAEGIFALLPSSTQSGTRIEKTSSITPEFRAESKDIYLLSSLGIDNPTDFLEQNHQAIESVRDDLLHASESYAQIHMESTLGKKVEKVAALLERFSRTLSWYLNEDQSILKMLGHAEPQRYMVFNQNRDEIRANGGFPGSVIAFTLYKGNILDLRTDDIYYYDWNLYPYKEVPPPGLALLTDSYGLRDVNYYPDFRLTLEKANAFVERSGDSTLTTGIAIHQGIIEDIMNNLDPVTLSGVTIPLDGKNFSLLMSLLVENQYNRENTPKDILFAFGKELLSQIHKKKEYALVFDTILSEWNNGEILVASRDKDIDDFLAQYRKKLPWECQAQDHGSGSVSAEKGDVPKPEICPQNWLYPVFISVSGNKSDRYIERIYTAKTTRIRGCTFENQITLTNKHTYTAQDTIQLQKYMDTLSIKEKKEREKLTLIEGSGKNKAFVRIYAPKNSRLAYSGSDIGVSTNEFATVFSFSLDTLPSSISSKTIRTLVDIPNCETLDTNPYFYKQPGLRKLEMR